MPDWIGAVTALIAWIKSHTISGATLSKSITDALKAGTDLSTIVAKIKDALSSGKIDSTTLGTDISNAVTDLKAVTADLETIYVSLTTPK